MKSFLLIGAVLGMANACNKATTPTTSITGSDSAGYQINGQLTNAPAGSKVYLSELGTTQFIARDTATLDEKGHFSFKGTAPEAGLYQVKLTDANQVLVALDNKSNLELSGDATSLGTNYTVKGSKDSELLQQLSRTMQQSKGEMQKLEQRYTQAASSNRPDSMKVIEKQFFAAQARNAAAVKQLVRQNPNSVVSAFAVGNLLNPDEQFVFADSMATQFKKTLPDSRYTKELTARLDPLRSTALGVVAPEIKLAAPDGKEVALSSLRGKYVLIDFWASWCGPCRQENPNVVKAYNKFKGKGFEIYSVSFDQDRAKWLKAIEKDGLTWTHVSDLKGWESAAGQTYSVKSIPQSVLLDPQGRIIAKNLRGEALDDKLASLLGGKQL
ncbi:TlpA disulfide reductase family protein [Hymenobacter sp. BT491]|uniref:TlpA disulfide reductase family protein n=1 Tax=Hymenobacter sp. BT491 TaxID=2766779 RepID=UPI001653D8AC|nr:TlpA disulfide reductase family protein [Hymenobacter sp. BT491]MBC6989853.1 AhpC/TSA family protein [Hymenobacter sp. BT491]